MLGHGYSRMEKWWEVIEGAAQSVSDRLLDLARIDSGQKVLDIATGIGEPALTAARLAGSAGRVTETDQSPNMLELALRSRMKKLGIRRPQAR